MPGRRSKSSKELRQPGTVTMTFPGFACEGISLCIEVFRSIHDLFLDRAQTHPQELRETGHRAEGAVPDRDPARVLYRVPAGARRALVAPELRPAAIVHLDLPHPQ